MKLAARIVVALALGYSVALWLLHVVPWWRALPDGLVMPVSAQGCGSAEYYRNSYEAHPEIRDRVLPIVMAAERYRGAESATSQWSCDTIAEVMRAQRGVLELVPQRFLCASVRHHVVDLYESAHLGLGPPLWIVNGEAVGSAGVYDALTSRGLAITPDALVARGTERQIVRRKHLRLTKLSPY